MGARERCACATISTTCASVVSAPVRSTRMSKLPVPFSVPVFLMSGKADAADQLWAREVGARALLVKPLDAAEALVHLVEVAPRGSRGEPKGGA